MFSQNELIDKLQLKIDDFVKILDFNTPEEKSDLPKPRNIIPPYIAKAMLAHYKRTKDELLKEYDDILERRKQITDNDNPELATLDCKISELQKKLEFAITHYEAQKRSNQKTSRNP